MRPWWFRKSVAMFGGGGGCCRVKKWQNQQSTLPFSTHMRLTVTRGKATCSLLGAPDVTGCTASSAIVGHWMGAGVVRFGDPKGPGQGQKSTTSIANQYTLLILICCSFSPFFFPSSIHCNPTPSVSKNSHLTDSTAQVHSRHHEQQDVGGELIVLE